MSFVKSNSIRINTDTLLGLYIMRYEENNYSNEKCKLMIQTLNFDNSVQSLTIYCGFDLGKRIINDVSSKVKSEFINIDSIVLIKEEFIKMWYLNDKNKQFIVDLSGCTIYIGDKNNLELLDKKLVASCHILESESSWNWNNEIEEAKEYLLQMKAKKNCLNEIYEVIKSKHSYKCFEFAVYNITSINEEYLNWIDKEIK